MSTLGGVFRIGSFIGPFVGAPWSSRACRIGAAYAFAAAMSLAAAVLVAFLPDVTGPPRTDTGERGAPTARCCRSCPGTAGCCSPSDSACCLISAARATRQVIIPLWAEASGSTPPTTSLIFGISAGVDLLLFYPGGAVMDRFGRVWVAVPA